MTRPPSFGSEVIDTSVDYLDYRHNEPKWPTADADADADAMFEYGDEPMTRRCIFCLSGPALTKTLPPIPSSIINSRDFLVWLAL